MALLEEKVKERTADLEKSNYELSQLTSVATHDLKEPIRKISIFSGRLKDMNRDKLDENSIKQIDTIISSSKRLVCLIDDLLEFSKLSQVEHKFSNINLHTLLDDVVDDFDIQISSKAATISYDGLPVVFGVEFQLRQLFQNLISNSLKFAHSNRNLVIKIKGDNVIYKDRNAIKITYRDNGIGFNPAYAERIFEVFERLHGRDKYQGTALD